MNTDQSAEQRARKMPLVWASLVLVVGLISTVQWVQLARDSMEIEARTRFELLTQQLTSDIESRFNAVLSPLLGVRAFLLASASVNRSEFRTYVLSRNVEAELPGVRGIGLIERVDRTAVSRYVALQRKDGAPDFKVSTRGTADDLFVISFLEPLARNKAAIGLDIGSEPNRRAAAQRAARTGEPSLTAPIVLVQDDQRRPGFLFLLPWFDKALIPPSEATRAATLRGWVYAPLVLSELMEVAPFGSRYDASFEIFSSPRALPEERIFVSDSHTDRVPLSTRLLAVTVGGTDLFVRVSSTPAFERSLDRDAPVRQGALGAAVSLLMSWVAWLLLQARFRAQRMAHRMTRDLDRLATVARHTTNAVTFTDLQERIVWVNEGFTRISGYSSEEAMGKTPGQLLQSERTSVQTRSAMRQAIGQRVSCREVVLNTHKNGTDYWIDLEIQPLRNAAGTVTGFVALGSDVTADMESKQALERSQAILKGSMDAVNEAYVLFDPQDRLLFCNQKYRDLYALSADLIVPGATFESIIRLGAERGQYRDAIGRVDAWVQERMAAHLAGDVTLEQRLESGRWVRIVERRMDDGHLVGFRVDITELKQATEAALATSRALSEQQERLQSILRGTNVGTWEWNVQTGECLFDERWTSMLGYTLEELQPATFATWQRLMQLEDRERCNALLQEHFDGRSDFYEAEVAMTHKAGHLVWVLTRGQVSARAADGKPLRMAGTHMDITERKSAELALAHTTSTLQSVLDSAVNVGIIATDLQRVVRVFSKGAENLLGYSADELVGKSTPSLIFDLSELAQVAETLQMRIGRQPTTDEIFSEVANSKMQTEWTLVRKDGSRFASNMLIAPMRSGDAAPTGYLAMVYDITRQKENEAFLRETMRLAEQSSVAKSQFLANMSHELRTPMNAILGMLQLLHSTPLNSRQLDYTEKTEGAAKALLSLLNDILDFSKVEAGKMQLDPYDFSVSDLLADLSVILSSNLRNKPVDLVFDLDPALPPRLLGDALRLKQVLINLAGNAVKFTEVGQVTISLRQIARHDQSVHLEVAVADTGIGIAPENQALVFQAFTQAESSTTRRFGGTGLGLVIATRLIRLMDGELQLQSELGRGSRFSFEITLPVPDVAERAILKLPSAVGSTCRVLLVDDNTRALTMLTRMLTPLGWEVVACSTGGDAIGVVQSRLAQGLAHFDVLLVDQDMPEMDGWQTLRAIARCYGPKANPLRILVSNQNREVLGAYSEREQNWLDGFLVKPLTAAMVAHAVANPRGQGEGASVVDVAAPTGVGRIAGMRLLVVEDNLINQQVAQELLQGQGAIVTLANDGQQGLDALAAEYPLFDAVLMDLQMPVMDGLTAVRVLRQNPAWRNLPVVAMTANAMASDREACLAAGMNDHVGKPFDLQLLIKRLIELTGWAVHPDASTAISESTPHPVGNISTQLPERWPAEIEVELALNRMGGNRNLLARSIRAYSQEAPAWIQRAQNHKASAQWLELARELHSLKGLSATIGVDSVRNAAALAEVCVKDHLAKNAPGAPSNLDTLIEAIRALLVSLDPALAQVADQLDGGRGAAQPRFAGNSVAPLALSPGHVATLQTLCAYLQDGDMQAMEAHASLDPDLRETLGSAMDALDAAMAEMDFASAAIACEALLDTSP